MQLPLAAGLALSLTIFFCGIFLLRNTLTLFKPWLGPMLSRAVGHPVAGVALGALTAALVQSSSATNAVVVGFVAAGVLGLRQAFPVMLGANVGTTVTAHIASLGTLDAGLILLMVGLMLQVPRDETYRSAGAGLGGVGGMFLGLWALSLTLGGVSETRVGVHVVDALRQSEGTALVFGASLTAVVQSSSAVTSLLVALADAGVLGARTAVAGVLGSNVGTVGTTLLASISGGLEARQAAVADLTFNIVGVACAWPLLSFLTDVTAGLAGGDPGRQVAYAHTLFNLISVVLILPFLGTFCRLVEGITPGRRRSK